MRTPRSSGPRESFSDGTPGQPGYREYIRPEPVTPEPEQIVDDLEPIEPDVEAKEQAPDVARPAARPDACDRRWFRAVRRRVRPWLAPAALVVFAFLAGWTAHAWWTNADSYQFAYDRLACLREARTSPGLFTACMEARGYEWRRVR